MPVFCHRCGAALADQAAFCSVCGTPVASVQSDSWKSSSEPRYSLVGEPINSTQDESAVMQTDRRGTLFYQIGDALGVRGVMFVALVIIGTLFAMWRTTSSDPAVTSSVQQDEPPQRDSSAEDHNPHISPNYFGGNPVSDGRTYSVALIVAASDIPVGTQLFAQGRVVSFGYAGMRSRPFAIIEDEQQPGKTLLCAMMADEGAEVLSLYHQGESVQVFGEYMGTLSLAGNPSMPTFSDCKVASPTDKVVRPSQASEVSRPASVADDKGVGARDDWKQWETRSPTFDPEADLTHSLADAPLTSSERSQIYKVIDDTSTPDSFTDSQREEEQKTVMSARVGFIGLAEDGSQQVLVKGPESPDFCGASGNCPIWIFIRRSGRLQLALGTGGQFLILRGAFSKGFHTLATGWHMGAGKEDFSVYRWNGTKYGEVDCYEADIDSNPPLITDCKK
jgi:hypothetical protein